MRSLEVHVFETGGDIDLGLDAGLLELDDLDETRCSDCDERIGHVGVDFVEFAMSLDEDDDPWFTCTDCADPVINSEKASEWVIEFDGFSAEVDDMMEATIEFDQEDKGI